jgi:N-acyl-D-aspartate/D-glutamate deacylase
MAHDLVIRGGRVVDGSGAAVRTADVAVDGAAITAVGRVGDRGRREIDADGALVTPGFVDIHTHYDGQATWDDQLAPSSWHGVTTVVMGNCGVGFAPVRPADHERLIELMEGVEDIPGSALHEGLSWSWETFPEYLDELAARPRDVDLGAQVPHGALRLHVMGERGANRDPATPADIAAMGELAREAVAAGALGFTTSRTLNHRSSRGELTPTLTAAADELVGIAEALGSIGAGVLQVVSDFIDLDAEFETLRLMAARSGRPISISVAQSPLRPDDWKVLLDRMAESTAAGVTMRGQVGSRAVGLLLGFEATLNPFMLAPAWEELGDLPAPERAARLRRNDIRRALVEHMTVDRGGSLIGSRLIGKFELMFRLGDPPDYEPDPSTSIAAMAAGEGRSPAEVAYDVMLEDDGRGLLYLPTLNFVGGSLDSVGAQLSHPASVAGLSDGGAHVGTICDVSFPTTLLQWWGRDRPTGRLPVELLVHKQTRATAKTVGLLDRGLLAPGYRADVNVIDFDRLALRRNTGQAGSKSVRMWLRLASGTSRQPGINAASSLAAERGTRRSSRESPHTLSSNSVLGTTRSRWRIR